MGGVVADLGTRLVAVQQFDGGVGIEYPGRAQGFAGALAQGCVHPGRALRQLCRAGGTFFFARAIGLVWRQMRQRAAQAFVADDLVHAEYLGGDTVAAQSGNVRVAPLPVQDRQQPGAKNIHNIGRVGAGVGHRASVHPAGE